MIKSKQWRKRWRRRTPRQMAMATVLSVFCEA